MLTQGTYLLPIPVDGCVSYNDLNRLPWLFEGKGDIQYEVYREMREATRYVCVVLGPPAMLSMYTAHVHIALTGSSTLRIPTSSG